MTHKKNKTLLVGWDAADWDVINPLIAKGVMPALKQLLEKGSSGKIATLNPPLSPMLWTSIATGKRAYDHGITGFTEVSEEGNTVRAIRGSSRKAAAFWEILNEKGLKTNIIGWWPSHPAEQIHGAMVSNFYGMCNTPYGEDWPMLDQTVYPESLFDEMKELRFHPGELTAAMLQPFFPDSGDLLSDDDEVLRSVMKILAHASSVHNAATWLLENTEWDSTAVYYDAIDHFSHLAMKYHPPKLTSISGQDFKKYHYIIEAAYRFHDMMLARLVQLAGPETNIILVSDHGFESGENRFTSLPNQPAAPALEHNHFGMLVCSGPAFKKEETIYGSSLLDICPTLLRLHNLPHSQDMEGRVLADVFLNSNTIAAVATYSRKSQGFGKKASSSFSDAALKQLVDIGYLDESALQPGSAEKTLVENDFNLALACLDGGKTAQAIEIMERVISQKPRERRFLAFICKLYLASYNWEKFLPLLKRLEESDGKTEEFQFLKGHYFFATQQYTLAQECFLQLSVKNTNAAAHHLLGKTYLKLGAYESARESFQTSLTLSKNIVANWVELAKLELTNKSFEKALDILLDSLDYIFVNPETHKLIGVCLIQLQHFQEAVHALELSLKQNTLQPDVVDLLNELYANKLNQPENKRLKSDVKPKIIVSGLPRSGTSMLMQILEAGGLKTYSDNHRQADENNPKGYYEFKELTTPFDYAKVLSQNTCDVFKITYPLVQELPRSFSYKVVAIERDLQNVIYSQNKMKGTDTKSLDFSLSVGLSQLRETCDQWLSSQNNVSFLKLKYEDILSHPQIEIEKLRQFLGVKLDIDSMHKCVEPELNRSQL